MTPRQRDRFAWVGALLGMAEWTRATLAEVAAKVGPPPYATLGDGEAELIAKVVKLIDDGATKDGAP